MSDRAQAPFFDGSFPHRWQAEILPARPLILPARHFVYPRAAEEVERGALEVLIRPGDSSAQEFLAGARGPSHLGTGEVDSTIPPITQPQEFLATCALGFRDPAVPTGLWSTPNPEEICAVSGGYAYIIHTAAPERFTMIEYRPVLDIRPAPAAGVLLFVGHHSILAWGADGQAWQSEKLSDEGITLEAIDGEILRGLGWDMHTDKEHAFALNLKTGLRKS
ncbi:MAG: hypothetical protein ABR923_19845 [Terracidiphilus sp.]